MKKLSKKILSVLLVFAMLVPTGSLMVQTSAVDNVYSTGDIVTLGTYPQTLETNTDITEELDAISKNWISYKYMQGNTRNKVGDYMQYADIDINSDGAYDYRAVTFSEYRNRYAINYGSFYTYQDKNNYFINNIYYFRYEPLTWQILNTSTGLITCTSVIDGKSFNDYLYGASYSSYYNELGYSVRNWEYSSLGRWINDGFYNCAFTSDEKTVIEKKISLLSYSDVTNASYGFNTNYNQADSKRIVNSTDYAICQGITGRVTRYWLKTSGFNSQKDSICAVFTDGKINTGEYSHSWDIFGVRPAMNVNLTELEKMQKTEHYISGKMTGSSNTPKIAIDGTWYEYDTSIPGLAEAIDKFAINEMITCKIKFGKIIACSKTEINNRLTLSINTKNNNILYDASTKKYNPEKITFNINATNNITSSISGTINTAYIAGYDITFDKLQISCYNGNMLYFKDGWFGLGETKEIEKKFDTPITLKAGETFNFNEDLTAYINDDYVWGDELKKEAEIHVCAYNGDTQVSWNVLRVNFQNKTTESNIKNKTELNKKIENAASLLEKTTGVIYSPYLEELLTKDGLTEVTNALKCKVALSSTILKAKKNETLEDKLIDKLMKKAGISKEWMGTVYTSDIIHSVSANTKEHGKFEVEFNIKLTNVSIGKGNPYAGFSFETTYNIKGGKNIKERTGFVTSYFGYADIQTFADSVEKVALEQIEYAYNLGYGDNLNEVCEMFFDDTITSILSKTKAESYSHLFYESMIYPTKQMNVHCPVDIFIYDSEGTLYASVENNEMTMTCDDIDIEVIGDEKYLTIYDGEYSIEIIATANDDMDIEINEYSSKDRLLRTTEFKDILLTPGDSFMTTVDENYLDSKYELVKNEEDVVVPDNDESSIHYLDEIKIIDKEVTCTEDGKYHIECKECKETVLTEIIPTIGHKDDNHDGICDACSEDFTKNCSCNCHSNAFMQFLHKILCFLYRIFGMEQYRYCGCGKAHW